MSDDKKLENQKEDKNPEEKQEEEHYGLALGLCMGVALGMSIGQFFFNNMTVGMCYGVGIGLCLGTAYDAMKNRKKSDGASADDAANKQDAEAEPEEKKQESGEE